MHVLVRAVAIVALVGVLVGMGVHYADVSDEKWPYPGSTAVITAYDDHVGDEVFLFGTVLPESDADVLRVRIRGDGQSLVLTVVEADVAVSPGGRVQVYGTLEEGHVVTASNVVVVNPAGSSNLYKYTVSAVGAVVVVVLFFGRWRVYPDEWALTPREDHDG